MIPGEFFKDEGDFQRWVVDNCKQYAAHVQPITGDPKYPGIPDLSIGMPGFEVWAELKCWKQEHPVYTNFEDAASRGRELTAQQRLWLKDRNRKGGALCGVLIAWRMPLGCNYVSFIPIKQWLVVEGWTLAALALSPYTETLNRLQTRKATIPGLLRGISNP